MPPSAKPPVAIMSIMKKIGVYLLLLFFAAVVASFYGAVHDQISYTFSAEYFTKFKFEQFGMPWARNTPRAGAALVGALATWWMGVLIFMVLGLFGFFFRTPRLMAVNLAKSFVVVILVALVTGLVGLAYGYYRVNDETIAHYMHWVWPEVDDPVQFVRVGFMHNASYLGGVLGLITGIAFLLIARQRYPSANQTDR